MVGNEKDAMRLATWFYDNNPDGLKWQEKPKGRTPAGFKRLGSGSYRIAYLHKASNVVYKIDRYVDSHSSMSNSGEVENYPVLVNKVEEKGLTKVKVPQTSGHEFMLDAKRVVVCAMEFIAGKLGTEDSIHYGSDSYTQYRSCGVSDQHGGNYIVDAENNIWVIDLGGYV